MSVISFLLFAVPADAAEVVWLAPPTDADRDLVAAEAGATGPALDPVDLRAAATRWTDADDAAYAALDATLSDVRAYETRLDGELVIMRDLAQPLSAVGVVRDEADRGKLFAALAYQGFAVNRFFGDQLATSDEAAPYRAEIDGVVVEAPWLDAVALDPEREVTPYDIAEAPQRVAYGRVAEVVAQALPASIHAEIPAGGELVVDGRVTEPGPAGNVKVPPGRHLVHAALDGRVVARWDVRVAPGEARDLALPIDEATWSAFLDGLPEGGAVPDALLPSLDALGGEVWVARPGDRAPQVWSVTRDGVRAVPIRRATAPGESEAPVQVVASAMGAWFYSADFLKQEPVPANDNFQTVNAVALSALLAAEVDLSGVHLGAGLQAWVPVGDKHVARSGDDAFRVRPYPHLSVGTRFAAATAGFLFPYHPAAGARLALPVDGPVELHLAGLYGFKGRLKYGDGREYESGDIRTVGGGLGMRF